MKKEYYQKSDYTNIYNYLSMKIPKFIFFIPFVSNVVLFLVFTSLLDVKLTDRKLALKLRKLHNFFIIFVPFITILSLIISILVLAINYKLWNLERNVFVFVFLIHLAFFLLLNPILLNLRNHAIHNKYYKISLENKIPNFYNPTTIKNWNKYILNYTNNYKGKSLYRASENFKLSVEKPVIFNDKNIEYQKNQKFEDFHASFYWFNDLIIKYFGSLFISTWLAYLMILTLNFQKNSLIKLKLYHKLFINWLINFFFGIIFIVLAFYVSFASLSSRDYLTFIIITIALLLLYFFVSIIKMFIIKKIIKFRILNLTGHLSKTKSKNRFATNFLTTDQNQQTSLNLAKNLLRKNHYIFIYDIILTFFIALVALIIGLILDIKAYEYANIFYYVGLGNLIFSILSNYLWIFFLLYLAKKINYKQIINNKWKIILFGPYSLFIKP